MVWTKSLVGVPTITQGHVDRWSENDCNVPKRKRVKGYSLYIEGYIHDVEVKIEGTDTFIRARSFPALKKNDHPYRLTVTLSSGTPIIRKCECDCKAGTYNCSHCLALLYLICQYQKQELQAVPPCPEKESKTSRPQSWHIPQRTEGLHVEPVDSLRITKVKPSSKTRKRKQKVTEGVVPKVYCPVQQPIPHKDFSKNLLEQLSAINSEAQILRLQPDKDPVTTESRFGPVPVGSVLSYQQKKVSPQQDILNHKDQPDFPDFPLPELTSHYSTALRQGEAATLCGLQVTVDLQKLIESSTRHQSHSKTWHDVRKNRLTSSIFKDVCSRRADHEKLATRFLHAKHVQTANMKYGIAEEPNAAKLYAEVTGNNVYFAGFVVNPSACHLGASPDRKVYDKNADPCHGLLEIKCSVKDNFASCEFLKQNKDGTFKLKCSHRYYYQVMGQMAITGMMWCDLFVKCRMDFHKERINFDTSKWEEMKSSLDSFYFQYFLPAICEGNK